MKRTSYLGFGLALLIFSGLCALSVGNEEPNSVFIRIGPSWSWAPKFLSTVFLLTGVGFVFTAVLPNKMIISRHRGSVLALIGMSLFWITYYLLETNILILSKDRTLIIFGMLCLYGISLIIGEKLYEDEDEPEIVKVYFGAIGTIISASIILFLFYINDIENESPDFPYNYLRVLTAISLLVIISYSVSEYINRKNGS